MRIAISTRGLFQGSFAISSIIEHLTKAIINLSENKHQIILYFNDPEFEKLFTNSINRSKKINNRLIWDHFWLPNAIKKDKIDYALFLKGTIPPLIQCKTGVLFHDLGYFDKELKPYKSLETIYMKKMMELASHKSKDIFSVSKFTKKEIEKYFNINSNKICVCYNNCSPAYYQSENSPISHSSLKHFNLPDQYIFFPTSLSPRKNISRVIEAFNNLLPEIPHHLVITGGKKWNSNLNGLINNSSLKKKIHILGDVKEKDMPKIYKQSTLTLYPSLLEGFGIPILEAFNSGSPVITSNITSMPEVAGGAALLVDPYDINDISEAILKLINDNLLQEALRKKGYLRAKFFSWNNIGEIILDKIENHVES